MESLSSSSLPTESESDSSLINRSDDMERRIESNPEPKIFTWYINFAFWTPGPYIIVALWFCTILVGIFYGFEMLNLTEMVFKAPNGTDGAKADDQMLQQFEARENELQLLLYYSCSTCGAQGNSAIELIGPTKNGSSTPTMHTMSDKLQEWLASQGPFVSYSDYYTTTAMYNGSNGNMTMVADLFFISASNTSAVGIITFDNTKGETDKNRLVDDTHDKCNEITHEYGAGTITVELTGLNALVKAMTDQSRTDVGVNCIMLVPFALCVLALVIRSWRLMLIPVICFIISICASFSILRPFAEHVLAISPFCPAIMMALTVAMSIDYSLFLLSRFVEETQRKKAMMIKHETRIAITREAVRQSTRWSGKVIALSGCILSLTFFGLLFYNVNLLQSVGLGCGLAVICTILVNLTCTPSLILIFPNFFNKFGWAGCPCEKISICTRKEKHSNQQLLINEASESGQSAISALSGGHGANIAKDNEDRISNPFVEQEVDLTVAEQANGVCERFWYVCGSKITVCPWSILLIVVVYAAIAPVGYHFLSFEQQLTDTLMFPRDSAYLKTYNDVSRDFSAGFIAPWNILILAKNGDKVYTDPFAAGSDLTYLTDTGLIMNETVYKCYQNGYYLMIQGVGYVGTSTDKPINIASVASYGGLGVYGMTLNADTQTLLYGDATMSGFKQVYEFLIAGKISENRTSSYYSMTTEFDPFYQDATEFVDAFRDYLYSSCRKYNYTDLCYFTGGSVAEVDMVREIYKNFGWVLGIIIGTVFCLMGCVFKSVFVPLRLFLTIAVPLSFVFGLSVMVYQNGLLSFLHTASLADSGGLLWLIPIMTVSVLIGLALDYDIFLFARIYEYRIIGGVSTNEAIVRGVYKTGSIITAAGVIMAISFCGLIFSQITAINQTGFLLVVGVLVDTFIIRTALVPAILSIADEVNWWPGVKFYKQKNKIKQKGIQMDESITSLAEIQQMPKTNGVNETM